MIDASVPTGGVAALYAFAESLAELDDTVADDELLDCIRALEHLKSAVAAAQARQTARFSSVQRAEHAPAGVPRDRVDRSVAAQVGLARRISPYHAGRYVGWANVLTTELPATFAALREGRVSEWRAMLVARETVWLSREHRAVVDAELAPRLEALGDRKVEAEAKKIGYRLDQDGFMDRIRRAAGDRHVSIRPVPDVMARLSAVLPADQAIAAYAELGREADRLRAAGDERSRGQLMADLCFERLTGQSVASGVAAEVCLLMTDANLVSSDAGETDDASAAASGSHVATSGSQQVDGGNEPALLLGYGPVPAPWARRLVFDRGDVGAHVWLRRLFRAPKTGELAAMASTRRLFTAAQRRFVQLRDAGMCRTPWCEAPIRHIDHVRRSTDGGPTSVTNADGLCEACNYVRELPAWHAEVVDNDDGRHELEISTPSGHHYRSRAPDPPTTGPPRPAA